MSEAGTLTRADLARVMQAQIGLSRSECSDLVESIIDHVGDALAKGENVKIAGFGSFIMIDKPARMGRNPKTGVEVPITARRSLSFRPSPRMRSLVAQEG